MVVCINLYGVGDSITFEIYLTSQRCYAIKCNDAAIFQNKISLTRYDFRIASNFDGFVFKDENNFVLTKILCLPFKKEYNHIA